MESSLTQSHSATVFTKPYSTIHSTKIKVSHILTSCAHRTPTVRSPYANRTQTVCSPYANRTPTVRSPVIHCHILGKSSACWKKCRSTGVPLVGFQLVGNTANPLSSFRQVLCLLETLQIHCRVSGWSSASHDSQTTHQPLTTFLFFSNHTPILYNLRLFLFPDHTPNPYNFPFSFKPHTNPLQPCFLFQTTHQTPDNFPPSFIQTTHQSLTTSHDPQTTHQPLTSFFSFSDHTPTPYNLPLSFRPRANPLQLPFLFQTTHQSISPSFSES